MEKIKLNNGQKFLKGAVKNENQTIGRQSIGTKSRGGK